MSQRLACIHIGRFFHCFLAAVILLATTAGFAQAAISPAVPQQYTLSNGLKVLIVEDNSFPVVASLVWYRVGTRDEVLGNTGVSHLVEHLLFQDVGKLKHGEIGATIARLGGQFNGYTSNDFTTFFELVPSNKLDIALKMEAERMRGGVFNQANVDEELKRIQLEYENLSNDPLELLATEVRSVAFQQHPYRNPIRGWITDLETLTPQQCKAFYDKYYWPNNATLVIVGDAKSAQALALAKKYFEPIARSPQEIPQIKCNESMARGERRLSIKSNRKQDYIEIAYHAPALHEPDAPAMALMERILNCALTGRLKNKLVDAKLCQTASAAFEAKKDPGLFTITCTVKPGIHPDDVLESIDSVLKQLQAQPISNAELRRAIKQAEFAFYNESDGPYRAGFHIGYFDSLVNWESRYTWTERLKKVTESDIQKSAKRYFNSDTRVIGWLGPGALVNSLQGNQAQTQIDKGKPSAKEAKPSAEKSSSSISKIKESAKSKARPEKTKTGKPKSATQAKPKTEPKSQVKTETKIKDKPESKSVPKTEPKAKPSKQQPKTKQGKLPEANNERGSITVGTSPLHVNLAAYTTNASPLLPTEPKIETAAENPKSELNPSTVQNSPQPKPIEPTFVKAETRTLVNGLNLILFESHLNPIVQIRGLVRAGESYDPPNKKGSSDVMTALLNSGSSKRTRQQTEQLQEDLGLPPYAMLRFYNDYDNIYFKSRCLSNDLPVALGLLADALQNIPLQDQDLEKAKKEAAQALRTSDQLTTNRIFRTMLKDFVVPNSAYYPTELGEKDQQINKLTSVDLKAFAGQRVIAPLTTIIMTGDINIDQAQKLAEKLFATYGGKAQLSAHSLQLSSRRTLRTSLPLSDNSQCVLTLGQLIPISYDDARYADMVIADCILSRHPMFSRIGKRLNKEPLPGASPALVDMQTNTQALSGKYTAWSILTEVSPKLVASALGNLQTEVRQLSKGGISNPELAETKQFLSGNLPVKNMSSLASLSKTFLEAEKQGADANYIPKLLDSVKSASLESVNKFIKGSMRPDQAVLIIAGPDDALRAARRQLTANDRLERSKTEKKPNSLNSKTSIELVP